MEKNDTAIMLMFLIITGLCLIAVCRCILRRNEILLSNLPHAMKELFNNMDQSVIILDKNNRIVKYNQSLISQFPELHKMKRFSNAGEFTAFLRNNAFPSKDKETIIQAIEKGNCMIDGELEIVKPVKKHYSVQVRPIVVKGIKYAGNIILLNEITCHKKMIEELNEKNAELIAMLDQLNEYSTIVEALAVERERNRMARDLHDTLGQSMTMINTLLKVCLISCRKDDETTRTKLTEALTITKNGIMELKRTVKGLTPHILDSKDLADALKYLIKDFEISGLKVQLLVSGSMDTVSKEQSVFIYRLCQEALTNSVRHGKAKNAAISIQAYQGCLKIYISDDGRGAKVILKGMGLTGMEQRIQELGGSIKYSFKERQGFHIFTELPCSDRKVNMELLKELA